MEEKQKFNCFAYYISQYFWILYFIVPLLLSLVIPKKTQKIFISSSISQFNKSFDPIIFAHVSDVHINSFNPQSVQSFKKTFNSIKFFSPEFVILTGDIVDNYNSLSFPRYGEQNEASWQIYNEEIKKIDISIIEVGGNHDMFGIKSIFSSKNYFLDSSHSFNRTNILTEDDFLIKSFSVGKSNTNVIAINPFDFPTSHPPLLLYQIFNTHLLNLLEAEISKSKTKSLVISHYPVGSIDSQKSSSGLEFTDIIGSKKSVLAFLSGHSHPKDPKIFHHGKGGLEILGLSSAQDSRFGLVTIDNDGISWSTVDTENPPKGVITYPIPKKQLSPNAIFNDKETAEIRVLIFSNQTNLSINFLISDSTNSSAIYSGHLTYSRSLNNGHSLYTFPLNKCIKKFGTYHITFSGDFDGYSEFVIDDHIEAGGEKLTEYPRFIDMLKITLPIYALILLIVTFPFSFGCLTERFNSLEEWIETGNNNGSAQSIIVNWLVCFFGGFLVIRNRFQKIPKIIKIFVLFSVVFGFVGPLIFFETEDLFGFICLYGYFIENRFIYSIYGVFYSYYFSLFVCTTMVWICSSFGVRYKSKCQLGDIFALVLFLAGDLLVLLRVAHETVGPKLLAFSIGFIFIPIINILLMIFLLIKTRKTKNDVNDGIVNMEDSITNNLLSK